MDCDAPVLYMSFPSGRLKFLGSVLHPKNKYMVLKMGSKQNVLCEHVFEHMVRTSPPCTTGQRDHFRRLICICLSPQTERLKVLRKHMTCLQIVFYKVFWIGMTSENPAEAPMPIPEELQKPPEDNPDAAKGLDFGRGLGISEADDLGQSSKAEATAAVPAAASPSRQLRTRARQSTARSARTRPLRCVCIDLAVYFAFTFSAENWPWQHSPVSAWTEQSTLPLLFVLRTGRGRTRVCTHCPAKHHPRRPAPKQDSSPQARRRRAVLRLSAPLVDTVRACGATCLGKQLLALLLGPHTCVTMPAYAQRTTHTPSARLCAWGCAVRLRQNGWGALRLNCV